MCSRDSNTGEIKYSAPVNRMYADRTYIPQTSMYQRREKTYSL